MLLGKISEQNAQHKNLHPGGKAALLGMMWTLSFTQPLQNWAIKFSGFCSLSCTGDFRRRAIESYSENWKRNHDLVSLKNILEFFFQRERDNRHIFFSISSCEVTVWIVGWRKGLGKTLRRLLWVITLQQSLSKEI